MATEFTPKNRRKFWRQTHMTLNDAVLKLHAPLAIGDPQESKERVGVVEDCITILTLLGFQIGYPDGCSTLRELIEKQEKGEPTIPQPAPLASTPAEAFAWFSFPAFGQNPNAKKVRFDKEEEA